MRQILALLLLCFIQGSKVCLPRGWLVGLQAGSLFGWLVCWVVGQSVGCLVCWMVAWLIGLLASEQL